MSLNNFPFEIDEYFEVLKDLFGEGAIAFEKIEPWYYKWGIKIFTFLHPDQAVKRFNTASWIDLQSLYSSQIARSRLASQQSNQVSNFNSLCGDDPDSRGFGQLPCTISSIELRVETISKNTLKGDPILVVGDDDALSIALAKNGFTDITVFEIDAGVVKKLNKAAKAFPLTKLTIVQQDVFEPVHGNLKRPFRLVSFDPWYALNGLEAFMNCALEASTGSRPKILLSFNCGALLSELPLFKSFLKVNNYKIDYWFPLANTYPVPRTLKRTIELAEILGSLLTFSFFFPYRTRKKLFFSSDLLFLTESVT